MEYNFTDIERRAKEKWQKEQVYKVYNNTDKPKYYVLDMFPYPSGAGLHVGHPLGYIASDIFARYKRLKGFNVLHPMGFDEFGLPAEQYALETGQHPAITTANNIARYREQLDNIGFSFDWDRKVNTSDPKYYKWTQWIFLQLFNSWYDVSQNRARSLKELIEIFEMSGNKDIANPARSDVFDASQWNEYDEIKQREILMTYRLAYLAFADVWWCEALGTVLANDEVVNGVSERGGHPVEKKQMRQWFLRITKYADRLLDSLDTLDWSDAMKEMQRNWIGRSVGAEIKLNLTPALSKGEGDVAQGIHAEKENETRSTSLSFGEGRGEAITVFTTRPDTIFGVDFMVIAPEHTLVEKITTPEQKDAVEQYVKYVKSRSERERISEVKQVTGCFTGAYAIHPFTKKQIPVWISEYVLAGYGTGAIMAVPSGDERDHAFAEHFGLPITNIFGSKYTGEAAYSDKTGTVENSGFLTGMSVADATEAAIKALEELGIGKRKVNYKLRDAGFSRQRYWGEPFPVVYIDDVPYGIDEVPELENLKFNELPVELPKVDKYSPGPEGQGPLANLAEWVNISLTPTLSKGEGDMTQEKENETHSTSLSFGEGRGEAKGAKRETNTMPGYAGSSWYFLRYMDPHNNNEFASREAIDYWQQVDLYVGGTEHAVGHLLYARMWTKALHDLGYIGFDEPFKKLLNQGMIQGMSYFIEEVIYKNVQDNNGSGKLRVVSINKGSKLSDYFEEDGNEYAKIIIRNVRIKNGHNYVDSKNRLTKQKYGQHLKDDFSEIPEKINIENELKNFVYEQEKTENGEDYIQCKMEIEKMSKSKYNVVNPDDIVAQYGADTFRMYEMFLGPVEMSKPWDTKGIEGVHRFLKKMWRLYHGDPGWIVTNESPTDAELRILHKTIKKVSEDIEKFSFNTTVSQFMITVNELTDLNCHKRAVLEPLAILICPFAPHFAEELWQQFGNTGSVVTADFPKFEARFIQENTKKYPVAINGKTRTEIEFTLDADPKFIENEVLADFTIQKWLEGKEPKKFIYVKGKMINLVV